MWNVQSLECAKYGLCISWIVQKMEYAEYRLCKIWNVQNMECAKNGSSIKQNMWNWIVQEMDLTRFGM